MERDLIIRTKNFSYNVYRLVKRIQIDIYNKQIVEQLVDSSFSVASNYRAAQRGKSKRDAANKIKIVLEEIDESNFWLQSIFDLKIMESNEIVKLIRESEELISIFVSITNKLSEN